MHLTPPPPLVLKGMRHNEWPRYFSFTEMSASFIGVTSVNQFDAICCEAFSPFYVENNRSKLVQAKFFTATGPAIVSAYSSPAYPKFVFPKEYAHPTRIVVSITNPACPVSGSHCHFSARIDTAYGLWWVKANNATGYRYVYFNTSDGRNQVSLGTLTAAATTQATIYVDPALAYLGLVGENYADWSFGIFNLYNYPAGTGYAAGTYPAAYYSRLNSIAFYWD